MKLKPFFNAHPVFRYEEFTTYMQSQGIQRPGTWKQQLNYHHKAGNLIHIRKSLYAVTSGERPQWIDPYVIAGKATDDGIIGYHTALELHGVAYTTFTEMQFLTVRAISSFTYEEHQFRPIKFHQKLIKLDQSEIQTETIQRQRVKIKLTSIERTIVDVLDRPALGGGWEEIFRSLDNITQLDYDKIINYALLLRNATLAAKVGYFLEQRPTHFLKNQSKIDLLLTHIPKQPHYMDRSRGEGKYIEKWRLIVPMEIIERRWEEPNVEDI